MNLAVYYQLMFSLHLEKYTTDEVENWAPFERDIYITLLRAHIEKQKKQNATNS